MTEATKRSIFRWIQLIFAIPIIGYIYSPFKELPNYAPRCSVCRYSGDCAYGTLDVERPSASTTYIKNALDTLVTATDLHDYLNSYIDLL